MTTAEIFVTRVSGCTTTVINIAEDATEIIQKNYQTEASNRQGNRLNRLRNRIYSDKSGFSQFLFTIFLALLVMIVLVTLLLVFSQPASTSPLSSGPFEWPGPSDSVEGHFEKAAVTTDNGICSEIGGNILKKGGNAIEGSIAVMFCLGIVNPQSSGLGGGFLMTLYNKTEGKCIAIDARESAPAAAFEKMFIGDSDGSKYGFKAAAVPGELAGYWYTFTRFGSGKVQWKDLIEPSIRLCREGVPVSQYLDDVMKVKERHFRLFPSMKDWINPSTNATYKVGDLLPRLKLANTLEKIAESSDPVELFYRGEMTEVMAKEFENGGGIITKEDFANYKVRVYETALINDHFRGDLVMCGGPPPSSFAVTQLAVSIMSRLYPEGHNIDIQSDPIATHHFIEAMKFAYAQRTLLGDHDFVSGALELSQNLTTQSYLDWVISRVQDKAQPTESYGGIDQAHVPDHGTSQVTILDEYGNGVSSTTTINRWFGAAVESEAYGILWNDEMDDFSTPGMANGFGFAPSETNFIAPGKRPMSSMSPMVIFNKKTKEPRMVIGGSGGSKIISSVAKAVIRSLVFGQSIKEAIDSPMIHNQFTPDITQLDDSFPKELKSVLEWKYGQKFRNTTGFEGIVQGITSGTDGISASGDFRRKTKQVPAGY
ncbi:unnamed protein product [Auanema sp. JU1783]|nr:unnamed protein product [Auanema sp. JU1783]